MIHFFQTGVERGGGILVLMSEFALFEVGKLQVFCSIEWRCLMSEGIRGFGCSISCILTHTFLVGEYGRKMKITYIPNAIAFSV